MLKPIDYSVLCCRYTRKNTDEQCDIIIKKYRNSLIYTWQYTNPGSIIFSGIKERAIGYLNYILHTQENVKVLESSHGFKRIFEVLMKNKEMRSINVLLKFSLNIHNGKIPTIFTIQKNNMNNNYMWSFSHMPIMFSGNKREAKQLVKHLISLHKDFEFIEGNPEFTKLYKEEVNNA